MHSNGWKPSMINTKIWFWIKSSSQRKNDFTLSQYSIQTFVIYKTTYTILLS